MNAPDLSQISTRKSHQPEDAKPNEELVSALGQVELRWDSQTYLDLCE